jgi:hypothetical protein
MDGPKNAPPKRFDTGSPGGWSWTFELLGFFRQLSGSGLGGGGGSQISIPPPKLNSALN